MAELVRTTDATRVVFIKSALGPNMVELRKDGQSSLLLTADEAAAIANTLCAKLALDMLRDALEGMHGRKLERFNRLDGGVN